MAHMAVYADSVPRTEHSPLFEKTKKQSQDLCNLLLGHTFSVLYRDIFPHLLSPRSLNRVKTPEGFLKMPKEVGSSLGETSSKVRELSTTSVPTFSSVCREELRLELAERGPYQMAPRICCWTRYAGFNTTTRTRRNVAKLL